MYRMGPKQEVIETQLYRAHAEVQRVAEGLCTGAVGTVDTEVRSSLMIFEISYICGSQSTDKIIDNYPPSI